MIQMRWPTDEKAIRMAHIVSVGGAVVAFYSNTSRRKRIKIGNERKKSDSFDGQFFSSGIILVFPEGAWLEKGHFSPPFNVVQY